MPDIRGFFEAIDHGWLVKFVEHRIADRRVVRLIQKWLNAGVLEDGTRTWSATGTPQGGSISPLLANVYLHYVFDLWATMAEDACPGDVIVVRYADDFIVGFQHREEAEWFLAELRERFARFVWSCTPRRRGCWNSVRYAAETPTARRRGEAGDVRLPRLHAHLREEAERAVHGGEADDPEEAAGEAERGEGRARRRWHDPIPAVGTWLRQVVGGHIRYYGVPMNGPALSMFRFQVGWLWHRALARRSHTGHVTWERMRRLIERWLPPARICHPYPLRRLGVVT